MIWFIVSNSSCKINGNWRRQRDEADAGVTQLYLANYQWKYWQI